MILLQGNNIARTFGADILFENINFTIQDNSRVSLVGRNGAGKSTLLKIIAGVESASRGEVSKTKNLSMSYLAQEQAFTSDLTIYDEMLSVFKEQIAQEKALRQMEAEMGELSGDALDSLMTRYDASTESFRQNKGFTYESDIKNVLNGFKFDQSFWTRQVASLSGGQKTRLALAKILLENPQLLILDEPTNHLDIDSREVLENALIDFPGTILFVSHDRYFINRVATKVLEIAPEGSTEFLGDYDYYVEKKEEVQAESNSSENGEPIESLAQQDFTAQKEAQKNRRKVEREIKACEERLADLEAKIAALLLEMQENTADFVKLGELQAEIDLFNDEKDEIEMTLLEAMEELENL